MDRNPLLEKLEHIEKTQDRVLFYIRVLLERNKVAGFVLPDLWYDDQEVMLKLHWSKSTLKRRRAEGKLPYTKIKNKFYYKESDVYALIEPGSINFEIQKR